MSIQGNAKAHAEALKRMQARSEARDRVNAEILALLAIGTQPKAICIDVKRSPSYVSKIGSAAGYHFNPGLPKKRGVIHSPCQPPTK